MMKKHTEYNPSTGRHDVTWYGESTEDDPEFPDELDVVAHIIEEDTGTIYYWHHEDETETEAAVDEWREFGTGTER